MKNQYNIPVLKKASLIWKTAVAMSAGLLCMSSITFGQAVSPGIAPMVPPPGGLHIEGNLRANTPTANIGDWLPGAGGTGGSVMNAAGVPIDAVHTYHSVDLFVSGDDVFNGGQKKDDNPNSMSWRRANPSPAKCDINHFLMHVAKDQNTNHTWIAISGDRQVTNGNSFISLQFLQKTLTQLPNNNLTTQNGTFHSDAPNSTGGRTVGDLQVSAEFLNGGGNPNLYLERWEHVGGAYKWVAYNFFQTHPNAAYGATNATALSTTGNYSVFGANNFNYTPNAFLEAAIDITEIVNAVSGNECLGRISSLWVMTKSSQSVSANMTDFVTPLQINLDINVSLTAADPTAQCGGTVDLASTITSDTTDVDLQYFDTDPSVGSPTPLASSIVSASGTYYIKASSEEVALCNAIVSVVVSIGERPAKPVFTIQEALMCDTLKAPKLTICNPVEGLYTLQQPGKADKTIDYQGSGDAIFTGLYPGIGLDLYVQVGDCVSDTAHCSDAVTTCPSPDRKAPTAKPQSSINDKAAAKNLMAFPVPFSDKVTIKFTAEKAENYVVNLYDMQGRMIKELKAGYSKAGEVIQFDVSGKALNGNLYLVRKVSNSGVNTIKLLKEK